MKSDTILYGVIGLLTGVILAGFVARYAVNSNNNGMMRMLGMHTSTTSQGMMDNNDMSIGDMTSSLNGKTGDDFDKAFISEMIIHHQGAITMANLAVQNAKHGEVKNLAKNIVSAQTKEINEMKSWQAQWGYGASSSDRYHNINRMR